MNAFIRAMIRIFSFGERLIALFNPAIAPLNETTRGSCITPLITFQSLFCSSK